MVIQPAPRDGLAQEIAAELARLPEVLAVAMAGSRTSGNHDARSDIDLYVYAREEVSAPRRREIAERRGDHVEIDNRFWETGDEWDERDSGTHIDVMFRAPAFAEDILARVLDRHEASLGYTTALWHNLRTSEVLFDRVGWLAGVKLSASRPYPDALAHAIIAKNWPLLRGSASAYPRQLALAAHRGDIVAVNHRLAALLASAFDVLFALNRATHPGEKRLLDLAARLPLAPVDLRARVDAMLSFEAGSLARVPGHVEAFVDSLEALLAQARALPQPASR